MRLEDFRRCEVEAVALLRFRMGLGAVAAAKHCALSRARIRQVERAILYAVRHGAAYWLGAETVKAARGMMVKRKRKPERAEGETKRSPKARGFFARFGGKRGVAGVSWQSGG